MLQRQKLEGALNSRKADDLDLIKEKQLRQMIKQQQQQDKTQELANKFRMAEAIRQNKKNLKQGKFFNEQLRMLVSRDDRAGHAIEMTNKVEAKKDRVARLEALEHEMINSL